MNKSDKLTLQHLQDYLIQNGWSIVNSGAMFMNLDRPFPVFGLNLGYRVYISLTDGPHALRFRKCELYGPKVNLKRRAVIDKAPIGEWESIRGTIHGINTKVEAACKDFHEKAKSLLK